MEETLKQERMKLIGEHKRNLIIRKEFITCIKKQLKKMEEEFRIDYEDLYGNLR